MNCPKCGSENVTVQIEQIDAKTKQRKSGCLWGLGRLCLIVFTCGLWLIIGKRKGSEKTKYTSKTVAICQQCGNKWYID